MKSLDGQPSKKCNTLIICFTSIYIGLRKLKYGFYLYSTILEPLYRAQQKGMRSK